MRKVLMLVALGAILAVPLVGSAGATGGLDVPDVEVECQSVFVPADVELGTTVEKEILIAGEVFEEDIELNLIKVFKTIEVEVCVKTVQGAVVAEVDLEEALKGVGECPNGGHGKNIVAPVTLRAGLEGGTVEVSVKVVVHDKDAVLNGTAEVDKTVVIEDRDTITVPPTMVKDTDTIKAKVCVGPVVKK